MIRITAPLFLMMIFVRFSSAQETVGKAMVKDGITLTPVYSLPMPKATLKQKHYALDSLKKGTADFSFEISNYTLGQQSELKTSYKQCANSAQGQHIHNIINNEPYTAHYTQNFIKKLPDGYYVSLSFLSRSFHESLKQKGAYVFNDFVVGNLSKSSYTTINKKTPHLFYSRPKGEYTGSQTEMILLDFYLVNCTLSPKGYTVAVEIDGIKFTISNWTPYMIEGLGKGEHIIRLTLLDQYKQVVSSPFNPVTRKITLKP